MTATNQLPAGTWTLNPSATTITVSAKKLGIFTIPATLTVVSGTIDIGDDHQVTNVDIVADAGSYTSKSDKRNEHVIGADFLDAGAHPTIADSAGVRERRDRTRCGGSRLGARREADHLSRGLRRGEDGRVWGRYGSGECARADADRGDLDRRTGALPT